MSEETTTTTTVDGAAAAKAIDDKANAAAATAAAASKADGETKVAPHDKADKKAEPKAAAKKAKEDDEDDDPEPDDKGMVTLPYKSFIRRVARMTKRELMKNFGTDDVESIVKDREELKALRADKDKRDRDAMSEKQKLEADLKVATEKYEAAELRAEAAETRVMVRETHRDLEKLCGTYVEDEDVDDVLSRLKTYMRKHKDEITKTKHAEAWVKDFVAKHPKYAKGAAAAETKEGEPDKKEPKKIAATTGGDKRPDGKAQGAPGPKHAMQMSKEELRAALAKNGLSP